jgi:hypothetical protein
MLMDAVVASIRKQCKASLQGALRLVLSQRLVALCNFRVTQHYMKRHAGYTTRKTKRRCAGSENG